MRGSSTRRRTPRSFGLPTRRAFTFGYLDESGTNSRWFGCGLLTHGPSISPAADRALNRHMRKLMSNAGAPQSVLSWKKVPKPGKRLALYERLVEGFFRHPALAFQCVLVDQSRYAINDRAIFHGSQHVGIDAFAFHLVRLRVLEPWSSGDRFHLRLHRRSRPQEFPIHILISRLRASAPFGVQVSVRSVAGRNQPLVQLADILLGTVVSQRNALASSSGKAQLTLLLQRHLGRSPSQPTPKGESKFNVWEFSAPPRRTSTA